jgi:hypothetical protein
MTTEIRLARSYGASSSGSYDRLSFVVPVGIGRIDVEYAYPRRSREDRPEGRASRETCVIDLGLYDEKGLLRGWSGSERSSAFVSGESATSGYHAGPIRAGTWAVALGIYRVSGEVDVEVAVTLNPKAERFLAGDLHVHTLNSDGAYSTSEVIAQCKAAGLDFVALTDHNNTAQNEEIGRPEGILVLPGMEYTNYRGHANLFFRGPSDFREDLLSGSREEMLAFLRSARAMGALVSVNHPFCDLCPWEFGLDGLGMDMVEIWNGPMKESDMRAVAWWHSVLSAGARLPAVCGSDTHRHELFRSFGFPTAFVRAPSASREDLLDALAAGRCSMSFAPKGPLIDITLGDTGLGGEVLARGPVEGRLSVERAREGDLVKLLDGRGRELSWISPFEGDLSLPFDAEPDAVFCRAELWRAAARGPGRMPFAISNPVYVRDGRN